jgi:HK97 family phage major capsid protein
MKKKELLEKRGGLIHDMKEIQVKAETEKREMTKEDLERWNKLDDEQEGLRKQLEVIEKHEALDKENETRINLNPEATETAEKKREKENRALRDYLLNGENMSADSRKIFAQRSDQTTTTSAGGYLVPVGFQAELEKAMLDYVPMWNFARVIRTTSGNDLDWPMVNDTGNIGEILGEAGANTYAAQAITLGQKVLKAYKFTSKVVTVSQELLQDSYLPIDTLVAELLAERLGRVLAYYFTVGSGSSQPEGCANSSIVYDSGYNALIAGITYDDIIKLIHSVDASYRKNGTFMFKDSVLKSLRLLKGTDTDLPLWQPSLQLGIPDNILGYKYIVNSDMPTYGAGNIIMVFGDFSKFIIRIARDITLLRLNELYAANLTVGFISFMRASSHLLNAGTNPIKYLHCGTT